MFQEDDMLQVNLYHIPYNYILHIFKLLNTKCRLYKKTIGSQVRTSRFLHVNVGQAVYSFKDSKHLDIYGVTKMFECCAVTKWRRQI